MSCTFLCGLTLFGCLSLFCLFLVVRTVEILLQCIGGKFLAHARTIQNTAAVVVNEGGTIDASCVRVAENYVHPQSLQATLESSTLDDAASMGSIFSFSEAAMPLSAICFFDHAKRF